MDDMTNDPQLLSAIYEKVCKLEYLLTGNGDPSKGMIVRFDRLEQAHKFWRKLAWVLFGAIVAPEIVLASIIYFGGFAR